ncbi:uncharacterized protein LOC106178526, partial [Lingula anatina]|uniref:Uncharacterized protein LOC106178526 n=1 Tax=Lingula anatina TaxID=7574 RepID=A0A1S3K3U0_LINAN
MATASLFISTVVFACIGIQVGYCCNTTIAVQCMLDYWPPADIGTPRFNADLILSMANGNGVAADVICGEATVVLEADVCLREALANCDSAAFEKVQTENGWVVEKLSTVNQLAQISVQIRSLCQGNQSPAGAPVNNSTPGCGNFTQDVTSIQACFSTISSLSSGLRLDNVTASTRTQLCTILSEAVTCGNAIANTTRCEAVHARYQNQILPSFQQVQQLCIEGDIE